MQPIGGGQYPHIFFEFLGKVIRVGEAGIFAGRYHGNSLFQVFRRFLNTDFVQIGMKAFAHFTQEQFSQIGAVIAQKICEVAQLKR